MVVISRAMCFSPVISSSNGTAPWSEWRVPLPRYMAFLNAIKSVQPVKRFHNGALEGQGLSLSLELGYAANRIDLFMMEVQGSGFVHFAMMIPLQYFLFTQEKQQSLREYWSCVDRARLGSPREDVIESDQRVGVGEWSWSGQRAVRTKPIFRFEARDDPSVMGSAESLLPTMAAVGRSLYLTNGNADSAEVPIVKCRR